MTEAVPDIAPRPGQHVLPRPTGWSVRRAGSLRPSKVFATREEAIAFARALARRQRTELYIHDRTGRIAERDASFVGRSQADDCATAR